MKDILQLYKLYKLALLVEKRVLHFCLLPFLYRKNKYKIVVIVGPVEM